MAQAMMNQHAGPVLYDADVLTMIPQTSREKYRGSWLKFLEYLNYPDWTEQR